MHKHAVRRFGGIFNRENGAAAGYNSGIAHLTAALAVERGFIKYKYGAAALSRGFGALAALYNGNYLCTAFFFAVSAEMRRLNAVKFNTVAFP